MAPREVPKATPKVQRSVTHTQTKSTTKTVTKTIKIAQTPAPKDKKISVVKSATVSKKTKNDVLTPSPKKKKTVKSTTKKRRLPAHSGVPVTDKVKYIMEKYPRLDDSF